MDSAIVLDAFCSACENESSETSVSLPGVRRRQRVAAGRDRIRRSFFKNGYRSIGRREPGLAAQAVVLALAIAQLVPPDSESGGGHYSDVVQLARRVTSGVVSLQPGASRATN